MLVFCRHFKFEERYYFSLLFKHLHNGDLLRCVDPYDVQVAEVDALLVQESGAGAAFGPHMALLGGGGGGGCLSRRRCKYCN